MKSIFYKTLERYIPYIFVKGFAAISKNEAIERIALRRFILKLANNPEKCIQKAKRKKRIYIIKKAKYKFAFFDVCFANAMMGNIIYSLYKGYVPIFDNTWNKYFEQPIKYSDDYEMHEYPFLESLIQPQIVDIFDEDMKTVWTTLYNRFIRLSEYHCKDYIENEISSILSREKTLGVLVRGTDYLILKPQGHPIQPTIEVIINDVKKLVTEKKYTKIYLATDEKAVVEVFENEFQGMILTNKRKYYDDIYQKRESKNVSDILITNYHFQRQNDDFLKGLEYLSSLMILSNCNAMIGGACGGTSFAYYMNNNQYEYCMIYNLGVYE